MKTASHILKRYYLRASLVYAAFLLLSGLLLVFAPDKLIAMVPLWLLMSLTLRRVEIATFNGVLFTDLDAMTFDEIVRRRSMNIYYRLSAAEATGNLAEVKRMAREALEKTKSRSEKIRINFWFFLMNAYFEEGDIEGLRGVIEEIDAASAAPKSGTGETTTLDAEDPFYRLWLAGDFAACVALCERDLPTAPTKLTEIMITFRLAASCARAGEEERARGYFEAVMDSAPRLYVAELSRRRLAAMEAGTLATATFPQTVPQTVYAPRKVTVQRVVIWLSVLLVLPGVGYSGYLKRTAEIEAEQEAESLREAEEAAMAAFEGKLRAALDKTYAAYDLLLSFNVYAEEAHVATCSVIRESDHLLLLSVVTPDGGETFECRVIDSELRPGVPDRAEVFAAPYTMEYVLLAYGEDIPEAAEGVHALTVGEVPYRFCVLSVEPT